MFQLVCISKTNYSRFVSKVLIPKINTIGLYRIGFCAKFWFDLASQSIKNYVDKPDVMETNGMELKDLNY